MARTPAPQTTLSLDVLGQRTSVVEDAVRNIGLDITRMGSEWRTAIQQQDAETRRELAALSQNLSSQINSLAGDIKKRSEIPWQALGVVLAFVAAVGGLAYLPIKDKQSELGDALKTLASAQVQQLDLLRTNYSTRDELNWRSDRSKEDRERVDMTIRSLQASVFPREVHLEKWENFARQFEAQRRDVDIQVANLQRQIETIQKNQGDTYTARDAIFDLKQRIDHLERAKPGAVP